MRDIRRQATITSNELVEIKTIPLGLIVDSDALRLRLPPYPGIEELAESIRLRGQCSPMFTQPKGDGTHELISGYCRFAALKLLNAEHAIVRVFRNLTSQEAYELAVSENQDRNNLSELERASICLNLQKSGRTTKQIAEKMEWDGERSVFRYLRVAKEATTPLREALQKRQISMSLATVFLDDAVSLPEEVQRQALAAAAEHEMSAAEFKRYLRRASGSDTALTKPKAPIRKLKDGGFALNTRVPADPDSIDRSIELLEAALKDARRLKKTLANKSSSSES